MKNWGIFIFLFFLSTANKARAECDAATRIKKSSLFFGFTQCSGSGGCVSFWDLPVVDPLVRGKDPDPAPDSSIKQK
jgi:hypothetical protein